MSYNGSGTFLINTSGQPVVTGTPISSTVFNALTADLATGLSTAITKDGQTATTARIPFAQGINSTLVTDSTSTTTGSIITAGGAGVAKALFVGTTANVAGAVTLQSTLGVTGATTLGQNLNFTGTGNRITGDFSNGTESNRVLVQTSTTDGSTNFGIIPNGTGAGQTGEGVYLNAASNQLDLYTGSTVKARIDSSGNLLVNTTTNTYSSRAVFYNAANTVLHSETGSTGTSNQILFLNPNGIVGSITTNGSATLYNVTSDQRLKENIQDADSASSLIDSLQVRKFDWKADSSHQRYGFVAQELVTVAPEAVHQPTDTEQMMAVDYSKLVPMLVKEIQSLRQRLAAAGI